LLTPVTGLLALRFANGDVLFLLQQTIGTAHAIALAAPAAIGVGFVIVDDDRPAPLHVFDTEGSAQLVLVRADRPVLHPEGGPASVAEAAPGPACLAPVFLLEIGTTGNELV